MKYNIGDEVSINGTFTGRVDDADKWIPLKGHRPAYPAAYIKFNRPHRPSEWTPAEGPAAWFITIMPPTIGAWFSIEDLDRWNAS